MPPKELAMFDWDDTSTTDSKRAYNESFIGSMRAIGVELPDEVILERVDGSWGSRHEVINRIVLRDQNVGVEKMRLADNIYLEFLKTLMAKYVKIVPGTVDMLYSLKIERAFKLGLTTAAPADILRNHVWKSLDFPEDLFDQVESAYDLGDESKAKPHPYTLQKIMRNQQIPPLNSVMIGDAPCDAEAAQRAGVDFIGVKTGLLGRLDESQIQKMGIRPLVADITKIVPIIEQLEEAPYTSKSAAEALI